MGKPTVITADTFATALAKVVSADHGIATSIQRLVVFGFEEYAKDHNSNWLTDIVSADWKATRSDAIKTYIEAHTDLVWTKMPDGVTRFKREAIDGFVFEMPEVTWFDFSNAGKVTMLDDITSVNTLIRNITASLDESNEAKTAKHPEHAALMLAYLKAAPGVGAVQ